MTKKSEKPTVAFLQKQKAKNIMFLGIFVVFCVTIYSTVMIKQKNYLKSVAEKKANSPVSTAQSHSD